MITLACLVDDFPRDLIARVEEGLEERRKGREEGKKNCWRAIRNGMSMYGTMLREL